MRRGPARELHPPESRARPIPRAPGSWYRSRWGASRFFANPTCGAEGARFGNGRARRGPLRWGEMVNLHTAKRIEELLGADVEASPYEYGILFEAKGWFARRRATARWKLLRKIDPKLRRVLRPGEQVYYVTTGTISNFGEQFFEGHAATYYVNLRALVFTTERIVLMQIGSGQKPGMLTSELPYASLREVKATWTGFYQLTLVNGKKHKLSSMPSADRKYLQGFLADVVAQTSAGAPAGGLKKGADGLVHLCPHCFTPTPGRPAECPGCGGGIRLANTAAWLSLAFPGLGDWYLGYRWLAAMEMMGAGFLWLVFVIAPLLGSVVVEEGEAGPGGPVWGVSLGIVAVAHVVDAVMTRSYGLKGHHPGRAPAAGRA